LAAGLMRADSSGGAARWPAATSWQLDFPSSGGGRAGL
jgi:hypothetical protein